MMYDYLVVGSGLYGAIFAHEAKAHGKSVLVVDKRPNIAGNIYTENIEGINVHKYGAHIFHTNNKKVWNYITQFAEFNRFTNSPVANYKGELYSLPFNMYTFNKMWGVVTPEEAAAKIEEQRKEITGEPKNLEEQAISLVGRDIYEKSNVKYLKNSSGVLDKEWVHNLKIAPFNFLSINGRAYEYETNTIWNKMYRASLLKDNEMWFDPKARKGQDVIFNAECLQLTDKFYYIHSALYHYRYLQESVTNRFNEKAQYYNEVAFENYERIIKKFSLPEEYWKAYYARVLTRLYSCMRLFYFHPENKMSRKLVNEQLNQTLDKYPYNVALKKVDRTTLTQSQRIFVFFLKKRAYGILRILVNGRQSLKRLSGARLKK